MAAMNCPPRKKRKLNDEDCDYLPSSDDQEDDMSEYEPSDQEDQDDIINTSNSNNKEESVEQKEAEINSDNDDNDDDDNNDNDDDNDDNDESDENEENEDNKENKRKLSIEDKKEIRRIFESIESFTATQLKSFLRNLKSLRSIDGESVFEDISMSGKKEELQKRIKSNIIMIYLGEVIAPNKAKWSWMRNKVYSDTIDFDGWKLQIKQFINLAASQSSKKRSKSSNSSKLTGSLISRLNACNKHQIISALESLLNQQQNGSELADQFEELLPKPNLENIFKRHTVLINAISKSRPWTRYGSSGDNYCFKRCRGSINTAKKAIIDDGKNIMESKEWDSCLEYLIVSSNNINKFPVWDNSGNNTAVRDLKKKLKIWQGKVKKGLGQNINQIQQKRLQQLDDFLDEKK